MHETRKHDNKTEINLNIQISKLIKIKFSQPEKDA